MEPDARQAHPGRAHASQAQLASAHVGETHVEIGRHGLHQRLELASKKWLAPGMTCWSITMPFSVFSFSTRVLTSLAAPRVLLAMHDQARGRAGREEREVVETSRRRDRDEALDLGAAHQKLQPIQAPKEKPATQQARASD